MSNPYIAHALAGTLDPLPPFDDRSLVVHVVLNVETWPFDEPMPRKILSGPHGVDDVPDVPNFSWVEYGMRVGLPRVVAALSERGIPAGVSMNAAVVDDYPAAADLLLSTGWEFIGHGVRQRSLHRVDDERAEIEETLARLEAATGTRPRGWLGPGLHETVDTLATLHDLGLDYVCDWCVDDVPLWARTGAGSIVAVPYNLELNDSVLFAVERTVTSEYQSRARATLDVLAEESRRWGTRVLALPLHPHLMGVPHRFGALLAVLDMFAEHQSVVFSTAGAISDWYTRHVPRPSATSTPPAQ